MDLRVPPEVFNVALPQSESDDARAERETVMSNRSKLAKYIHDVTLLFPFVKEKEVFTNDDCDLVRAEATSTLKVDRFLDIVLSKGPRGLAVFHEALNSHYPAVFDMLARLLENAGVGLPPTRRCNYRDSETLERPAPDEAEGPSPFKRMGARTMRRNLERLTQQCQDMQSERDALRSTLVHREGEIASLLRGRDDYHSDQLTAVTQQYQQLVAELVERSLRGDGSLPCMQELLGCREGIEEEYDHLEKQYLLSCSELQAALERISHLLQHLERSEAVSSITLEKNQQLAEKVAVQESELEQLRQSLAESCGAKAAGVSEEEADPLEVKVAELEEQLVRWKEECGELGERLEVAHIERKNAIDEKDFHLARFHRENERLRRKAEKALHKLRQKGLRVCPAPEPWSQQELTIVVPAPGGSGEAASLDIQLGSVVAVVAVEEGGVACCHGVRLGDEVVEVNHISLAGDRDPLEFATRLISSAAKTVTLSVRRQAPASHSGMTVGGCATPPTPRATPPIPRASRPDSLGILASPRPAWDYSLPGMYAKAPSSLLPSASSPSTSAKSEISSLSMSSDTGSSSEGEGQGGVAIPPRLSSSSEGKRSGLVSSPPPGTGCLSDYSGSHGLPDTITQRGTITGEWKIPLILREEEDSGIAVLTGQESEGGGGLGRDLGGGEGEGEAWVKPRSRLRQVLRRNKERRRSASLDDLAFASRTAESELSGYPGLSSKDAGTHEIRRVVLPRGQLGPGLKIVGGRGHGLFICSDRDKNIGFRTGDQIIRIGARSLWNVTYAEVQEWLSQHGANGDGCFVAVMHNMEGFLKLPSGNVRDNFHVRALYAHRRKVRGTARGELLFEKGAVFRVLDTLPLGHLGMWRAERIGQRGETVEVGLIPTQLSPLELLQPSTTLPRPATFMAAWSPQQQESKSLKSLPSLSATSAFSIYEPVKRVQVMEPRPVVLLGALETDMQRYLVEFGSTEDIRFTTCRRELGSPSPRDQALVVESVGEGEHTLQSTVEDIRRVASAGFHCVLSLKPADLLRPAVASLAPIALLLDVRREKGLAKIMATMSIPGERSRVDVHMERLKEARKYCHHCTGQVELQNSVFEAMTAVRAAVARQQVSIVWEAEDPP